MRTQLIPATLILAALAATPALTQTRNQPPAKKEAPVQRYVDADHDGNVSLKEWKGSPFAFAMQDANGDGVLSGKELTIQETPEAAAKVPAASRQEVEKARQARLFRGFDKDRDGRLGKSELPRDQFDRLDRDRDGVVTREEFTQR